MTPPNDAERALYTELTALLHGMRGASYAAVEAAVEERFQAFLRAHCAGASGSLEITQTMTIHDDAEPWAVYRTEYRVKAADPPAPAACDDGPAYDNVIPFPGAYDRRAAGARAAFDPAPPHPLAYARLPLPRGEGRGEGPSTV